MSKQSSSGKLQFYRNLEMEKDFFKFLMAYQRLKTQMLRDEKAPYCNGKIYNN